MHSQARARCRGRAGAGRAQAVTALRPAEPDPQPSLAHTQQQIKTCTTNPAPANVQQNDEVGEEPQAESKQAGSPSPGSREPQKQRQFPPWGELQTLGPVPVGAAGLPPLTPTLPVPSALLPTSPVPSPSLSTRRATLTCGPSAPVSPSPCQVCQQGSTAPFQPRVCQCVPALPGKPLAQPPPNRGPEHTGKMRFGPKRFPCSRLDSGKPDTEGWALLAGHWLQPWHKQTPAPLRTSALSPVPSPPTEGEPSALLHQHQGLPARKGSPFPAQSQQQGLFHRQLSCPHFLVQLPSALSHVGPHLSKPNAPGFGV